MQFIERINGLCFCVVFCAGILFFVSPAVIAAENIKSARSLLGHAQASCSADVLLKDVSTAYNSGHFVQAQMTCRALIEKFPENLTAHLLMGNIWVKLGNLKSAEDEYRFCLSSHKVITPYQSAYAKQALEHLRISHASAGSGSRSSGSSDLNGSSGRDAKSSTEDYIAKQTAMLSAQLKADIEVKQRVLDSKIKQIDDDNAPLVTALTQQIEVLGGSVGKISTAIINKQAALDDIKAETESRVAKLRAEFDADVRSLKDYYQDRISSISRYSHDIENQARGSRMNNPQNYVDI